MRIGRRIARNKYNNKKTHIDGIKFDSQKEAEYYKAEIKPMLRAGYIENLILQKRFTLIPSYDYVDILTGKKTRVRAVTYKADFVYTAGGITHIIDVKGFRTKDYLIKAKFLKRMIANGEIKNAVFIEVQ